MPILYDEKDTSSEKLNLEVEKAANIHESTSLPVLNQTSSDPQRELSFSWLYFVSSCSVVGSVSMTINIILADSFSANMALKGHKSLGIIRLWGSIGWVSSCIVLSYINTIESVPFLVPALLMFSTVASLNILLVAFWPDKRPFEISNGTRNDGRSSRGTEFQFTNKFWLRGKVLADCESDLRAWCEESCGGKVVLTGGNFEYQFDKKGEDVFRNIRRCSLAPLGDSFVIKQFELDHKSGMHFNHVTKIQPIGNAIGICSDLPTISFGVCKNNEPSHREQVTCRPENSETNLDKTKRRRTDLRSQLRILSIVVRSNKQIPKFLLIAMLNGFLVSMNWQYLFPYLESLDRTKFRSLSAKVMISGYLSETIFYHYSSRFMSLFNQSASLSLILMIYGVRYLFYSLPAVYPQSVPLEAIIGVELLQALNMGWFNCVLNELVVNFALDARELIPQLIKSGLVENSEEAIKSFDGELRELMVSVSSGCFDGFGVAFGSLVGGFLIDIHGFKFLWMACAILAFTSSLINILADFLLHLRR